MPLNVKLQAQNKVGNLTWGVPGKGKEEDKLERNLSLA